jgi:hypothetical protein
MDTYQEKWRKNHPDYQKKWLLEHPGYKEGKNKNNISKAREQRTAIDNITKYTVFKHYGNGKCACIKCGFDNIKALSLDHINNDGAKIRREQTKLYKRGLVGKALYRKLYLAGYPEGYQTLCMNCQFLKRER